MMRSNVGAFVATVCLEVELLCNLASCLCLVVNKPPFEVTETGWGEFEVIIKIYFVDPTERPVRL